MLKNYKDRKICVLGLGYVGLTLAVTLADVGFEVLGVEIRDDVLLALSHGKSHFHEPGLSERLQRVIKTGHFQFVKKIPSEWVGSVFIITVGTPLGDDGISRLDMVTSVTKEVADNLKEGDLVIMRSTVKLGTTRNVVTPILNKKVVNFSLAFCPERTLEGRALTELRELPQIVGGLTDEASVRASQLFQLVTPTVVRVSDIETAEMIKLVDNAQRDVAFAYANEVAGACDAVGISAVEVINAGKLGYPRTNLPLPGPVGGPCLEKDPHIMVEGLREIGFEPKITIAARHVNEQQPSRVISHIRSYFDSLDEASDEMTITLMGIAFKGQPATDDLRGTMARPIFNELVKAFPNAKFRGFDAVVPSQVIKSFGLTPVATIEDAFNKANLVLILNNHPCFSSFPMTNCADQMFRPGLIYDFWNTYNLKDVFMPKGVAYMALGSHGKFVKG